MRRPARPVRALRCLPAIVVLLASTAQGAAKLQVVAAENFYADIAGQVAGDVAITRSILNNPDQDPHLFEASPSVARELADADIAIENGADYDPWMAALLAASPSASRRLINVAALLGVPRSSNPHLWYDPRTMPIVARALAAAMTRVVPGQRDQLGSRLAGVERSLEAVAARVSELRRRYAGTPVTATEPAFGLMAAALGLVMRNETFQRAVMNNAEPAPGDVAAFEADLRTHAVKVMIYNRQASDSAAMRLRTIAAANHIPTIGISETEPPGTTYQSWMLAQLDALDRALSAAGR